MNDYDNVDFDVSVTESSSLTDKEILARGCKFKQQYNAEDGELTEQYGEEPSEKPK